jgi:hypothetical protein
MNITTPDQATCAMREALEQHGMPLALCHVPIRVRNLVPAATLHDMLAAARNAIPALVKVDDIKQPLADWCDSNPYVVITTRQLSEIAGCSQNVARKFVADNPHRFKRIDQYKHEVRNYVEERARDKATA